MSDHECGDIEDWEDASLPGGPLFSFRGSDSISHEVSPRVTTPSIIHGSTNPTPREPYVRPTHAPGPDRGPPRSYRPQIQEIPGMIQRSSGIQGRKADVPPAPAPLQGEAYDAWKSGILPNAQCEMNVTWKMLMSNIRFAKWSTPDGTARDELDEICRKTGAYVATPNYETNKFSLWGSEDQVKTVEKEIAAWVSRIRSTGIRPSAGAWTKTKAYDGRTESRRDQKERQRDLGYALRHMGSELDRYDFELYYQWPEEPKIEHFIQKWDNSVLEELRRKVICKIEFDDGICPHYKVSAQSESDIKQICTRMNNLMMEMVAQKGEFVKCNRFKLPQVSMYRKDIGWGKDPVSGTYLPTLYGETLPEDEVENWAKLCMQENSKNRTIMRQAISSCLASLHAPKKHVRMRVEFTELAFFRYDVEASKTFDGFCQMIPGPSVQFHALGLRTTQGDMANIKDILDSLNGFGPGETYYTLRFDFDSRNQSTLRLEVEFCIGIMTGELEIIASRWLEFAQDANEYEMLEINMLDLEQLHCNYRIHIGGTNVIEPDDIKGSREMYFFQDQVSFSAPPEGIKATPKRRAIYPHGQAELRRVHEITSVRYPFRRLDGEDTEVADTDGIFELQRTDTYDEKPHKSQKPTSTLWMGKYYYPEWDNLMGEFANLESGEQVGWPRGLSSFFLDKNESTNGANSESQRPLPKGFNTWLKEIETIQTRLTEAIGQVNRMGTGQQ